MILLILVCVVLLFYLWNSRDRRLANRGNEIIDMIEAYRSKEGRLPNSLREVGVEGEVELFYNKWDSVNYMVWYGTDLGESVTFYSDSRKWETGERGFDK